MSLATECPGTGIPESTLAEIDALVDRLGTLALHDWPTAPPARVAERATARAVLDAVIADRGLEVVAWYVRDLVETAACLACRRAPGDAAMRERAQATVEAAVLARLTEPWLPRADFALLSAPALRRGRVDTARW